MLDGLICLLIQFTNLLLDILFDWWIDLLIFMLEFLPSSPIQIEPIEWGEFGNFIGYFIPVQTMLTHFATILIAVTIWYGLQHVLRLVKMVR